MLKYFVMAGVLAIWAACLGVTTGWKKDRSTTESTGIDARCEETLVVELPRKCSDNFTYADEDGSCLYLLPDRNLTWQAAHDACKEKKSKLTVIKEINNEESIYQFLKLHRDIKFTWTALNDIKKEGEFRWGDSESVPPVWMWGLSQPPQLHPERDCVVRSARIRKWKIAKCTDTFPAICRRNVQELIRPKMKLDTGANLLSGDQITALCNATSGKQSHVVFHLNYGENLEQIDWWSTINDTFSQEIHYIPYKSGCLRKVTATIKFYVQHKHDQGKLKCCVDLMDGEFLCSHSKKIVVKYIYRDPELVITYHQPVNKLIMGRPLRAFCQVTAGGANTGLTWVLSMENEIHVMWSISKDGILKMVKGHTVMCAYVNSSKAEPNLLYGSFMESTIIFYITEKMADATLTCSSDIPEGNKIPTMENRLKKSPPFSLLYLPQRPVFEIKYNRKPDIIFNDTIMYVNCTAYVGTGGFLSWTLEKQVKLWRLEQRHRGSKYYKKYKRIGVYIWNIGLDEETFREVHNETGVVVTAVVEEKERNPKIRSTMIIDIGPDMTSLMGAIISCASHRQQPGFNYTGEDEHMVFSQPLILIDSSDPENVDNMVFTYEGLEEEPTAAPEKSAEKEVPWEENPWSVFILLTVLTVIIGNALFVWKRIPRDRRCGMRCRKRRRVQPPESVTKHASTELNQPVFDMKTDELSSEPRRQLQRRVSRAQVQSYE